MKSIRGIEETNLDACSYLRAPLWLEALPNRIWVACALLLAPFIGFAQALTGTVKDIDTQEPLRYATVSIISQNQRIVTRGDGTFTLDISRVKGADSITVSYIGYQTETYALRDLDVSANQQFLLQPLVYAIDPVTVTALKRETQAVGFTKRNRMRTGWGDFSSSRGRMRGVVIRGIDCSGPLKSFMFHIHDNDWDSVAFRLDLLSLKAGKPDKSLLPENIIFHTGVKNRWVTVNLDQYDITYCGDLLATLEWVDAWGTTNEYSNVLTLSLSKGTETVFTKEADEYEGKLLEGQAPLAMYVEVYKN